MFTNNFLTFLKELSRNNNTDWFNLNKLRFETDVKKPFETFIGELIIKINKITPEINIEPKEAIFRINKDIRFSSDKTPYKTEMSAVISTKGKKGNPCPGLYINIGPEKVIIAIGLKMLDKNELYNVRKHIASNLKQFETILSSNKFKSVFGTLQGDKIKRLPEEFKEPSSKQPVLFNTTFLAIHELTNAEITKPTFVSNIMDVYNVSLSFANFMRNSFQEN